MKKNFLSLILLAALGVLFLAGCSEQNQTSSEDLTFAEQLKEQFISLADEGKTAEEIAAALIENEGFYDIQMMTAEMEEGYLNGFDADITGFNTCYTFLPMINTIPFVGYVFETDDAAALSEALQAHAQLNWNICTEADEMVVETKDNLVFFVMSPLSFEE